MTRAHLTVVGRPGRCAAPALERATRPAWPRALAPDERAELQAQRAACALLVSAAERAVAEVCEDRGEGRLIARSAAILEDILSSWRETLSFLETAAAAGGEPQKLRSVNRR